MTSPRFKNSCLSRADLLELLAKKDTAGFDYLANSLSLKSKRPLTLSRGFSDNESELYSPKLVSHQKGDKAEAGFWLLEKREKTDLNREPGSSTDNSFSRPAEWTSRPAQAPAHYPITSPRSLMPRLLHHLKHQRVGREIDVNSIVKKLGRGEILTAIPRTPRRSLGRHLHLIDDRHLRLIPYWLDHSLFSRLLESYLPDYSSSNAILREGEDQPESIDADGQESWIKPPPNSVVLIFSDLGALSDNSLQQVSTWLKIGRQLQSMHCKAIAVLPCHPDCCDPRLKSLFTLESWEPVRHLKKQTTQERKEQAEKLLTLLAPAVRIEPGLLRQVRLSVVKYGFNFDASVEASFWQHPDLQESSSVAATLGLTARRKGLEQFSQQTDEVKQTILNIIRQWRSLSKHHVWFEEIISLDTDSQQLLPAPDIEDAEYYFQQMSHIYVEEGEQAIQPALSEWFRRIEKRLPHQSWTRQGLGRYLQRISAQLHENDKSFRSDFPIDPANLEASELPIQTRQLYQCGEALVLGSPMPTDLSPVCSRIASLKLRGHLLMFEPFQNSSSQTNQLGSETSINSKLYDLPNSTNFSLRSDVETLYFRQIQKPQWAEGIARDRFGLYTDLTINKITQRFRWIEPGTLMMGSPEDEPERWSDRETLHEVTLTQGYWLADTTVTQALWQAVMGKNPSNFKEDPANPVESVSWNDAQEFIAKMNQQMPGLSTMLPTEAQWEYPCRAGTTSPFSFGSNISPDQVNYDGNNPYSDGKKGIFRRKTVAVKSLPANPSGIYGMHGNVWEWCQDAFKDDLGTEPVIDPVEEGKTGARRVLRGGSWFHNGGYCRSAIRFEDSPGNRSDFVGFRLSLGHLSSGQVGGAVNQAGSRPAARPERSVAEQRKAGLEDGLWRRLFKRKKGG